MHAHDGKREPVDPDPEPGGDPGRSELPGELLPPDEAAKVVDRPDRRRHGRAEQQAARLAAELQEGERRHEDPEEEREAAEPWDRTAVEPPASGRVDDAEQARHPPDRRGQQDDDEEGETRSVEHFEVVLERPKRHFVP